MRVPSKRLFWAAIALLAIDGSALAAAKPNIVLLYADDLGYGDIEIQNADSRIPTPSLNKLATEGMRFTDAHSSASICSPSRYALLTGRYHWRKMHGIVESFGPSAFDDAELTLPELLRRHGYHTACIGKWHLGWNWDAIKRPTATRLPHGGYNPEDFDWSRSIPGGPLDHGFDYYFGDDVPNFPPYAWFENNRLLTIPRQPLSISATPAEGYWETRPGPMSDGWDFYAVMPKLVERTVEWIHEQTGSQRPFFLYVPFNSPHAPIVPDAKFTGRSGAGGYGDYVMQTDAAVGAILEAIESCGFADDTLVIFSSDNGPERYAYDRLRTYGHPSAGQLRGLKRDLWEGGHRVPMIVRWPGMTGRNVVSGALISQVDLFATIAAAAKADVPEAAAEDSLNLLPVWTAGLPSPRHTIIHCAARQRFAVRHDNWLLVTIGTGKVSNVPSWFEKQRGYQPHDQPGELHDLGCDLAQQNNLYESRPEKVAELMSILATVRGGEK